jgi:electron transport complex protein RnfG
MKKHIMPTVVLGSICIVVALLLSLTNCITAPIIQNAQNAAANEALLVVLPDGKNFEEITLDERYPSIVTAGYKADGGFVFKMEVTGYKPGLVIMVGINEEGKIVAAKHIATNETYGVESELNNAYVGNTIDDISLILSSGATTAPLTSAAYHDAMKAALQSAILAAGGSVDTRTPEQILQDNCNAALGTTDVKFTKWFATEILEGIDAVYVAADNGGRVFVIGETFVGVKDGAIVGTTDANAETVLAANTIIANSNKTEITELPKGVNKHIVLKAYVTDSGNYVFDLKASGFANYSYEEGYSDIEVPIYISISITADGKIIDCATTKQNESKGYGDVCGTDEYRDQWTGKTNDDIVISTSPVGKDNTDVGAIAGATYTTVGYQKAVKAAFAAFEKLTENGGEG